MVIKNKNLLSCSFCGKTESEVNKLISGPSVCICDECIELCNDILTTEKDEDESIDLQKLPTPHEIHEHLNEYIIGQEYAKKILSVAVYNHYKRLKNLDKKSDVELTKSNILLIGPTGSGKTLLAQTLARTLHVPFAIADATTLTESGYVGDDVESVLFNLLSSSNNDVKKAERGIIYIDEIDKITRKSENLSITRDVSGEGVQQSLLKIIEGTVANIPQQGGRKHPSQDTVQIDTSKILFIVGGAFEGLNTIIEQRKEKNVGIGFSANVKDKNAKMKDNKLKHAEPEDLMKFGLIPEFVGRLPVIASLEELDIKSLIKILTEPKNAVVKQFKEMFKMEGNIELKFKKEAITEIANLAIKRKTGARGLRSILEKILLDTMYELPSQNNVEAVIINKQVIQGKQQPLMSYKNKIKESTNK